ncbi:ParB/RepB/Spo0J family partition protein [Streptomyces sp. SID8352]|uniref:ParB/RepB/Spo0J family partition protein n=1 Tax=Streptomyces sp. SID8352 TaxID=2690338 RepID=UPI00137140CB|nr:ParB/RepB/Spo0J family partition protein [Streptomyces sp. SID8352]MYU23509.1 ParB/RepB/Spo0J family partition protein [Streptomyces sp. SID8352]
MNKADQLGAGRFGGGVRPISARRQAVAAATGVPTEGIAPPTELPTHRISLNPDNPRSVLGDLTDLAGSLKTHGQKQAITVMNRDVYVKANPDRETDLEPDTTHVVVDGSSRLAAAREAGIPSLKIMVSDDQGTTPEEILESALVANIHRQDLTELDEARALQRLLDIHGSQRALAKRLHRSQPWVSQRLALLNLQPELQARIGEEPIELLRAVGKKPVEQQQTALAELKAERAAKEEARATKRRVTPGEVSPDRDKAPSRPAGDNAVITDATAETSPPASTAAAEARHTAGSLPNADASDAIPEPRTDSPEPKNSDTNPPRRVPFDRPGELAMLLDVKMDDNDAFFSLLEMLSSKALNRDPARAHELARSFVEQAAARTT